MSEEKKERKKPKFRPRHFDHGFLVPDESKCVPYENRDPNTPYPISADEGHWYNSDSIGLFYDTKLLTITGNAKFWKARYKLLVSNHQANSGTVKSTRFKKLVEENNMDKLRAVCNVAYMMKKKGCDAWRPPNNVPEEERSKYWDDVWRWCSIDGNVLNKPKEWGGDKEEG